MTSSNYTVSCIERGAKFLAAEITEGRTPSLDQIAKAAHLSKYHFHRLFRLVTGETCAEAITRLRLAKGVSALDGSAGSVTEGAMDAGYSSNQAFAKALKRATGSSATELAAEEGQLASAIERFSMPTSDDADLSIELVSLEPFNVMVKRTVGRYPNLNQTYGDLFSVIENPEHVEAILGWPEDDIDGSIAGDLVFECGLKLSLPVRGDMDQIHIRPEHGGTFLRLRHTGGYDALGDSLDAGYNTLLSSDHWRVADRPCLFHYLDDPEETAEAALRTDLYIPIIAA